MNRFIRCVVLACALPAVGAAAQPAHFDSAELDADARLLDADLRALHPGRLRYLSEAQYTADVDALRRDLATAPDRRAAFLALSRFTAQMRCGHTFANPLNQPAATAVELFGSRDRLPFAFRWIDGSMVVTRPLTADSKLIRGTRVDSIDGIPAASILARLLPYVAADGSNDARRVELLGVRADARDELFDIFYELVFGVRNGRFRLETHRPDGSAASLNAAAMTGAERAAAGAVYTATAPLFSMTVEPGGIAVLRMPTWVTFKSTWDWQGFIDDAFVRLAKERVRGLVIDVRGNVGGTDVGRRILAHLIDRPVRPALFNERVTYRRVPDALHAGLATWDRTFFDWGDDAVPDGDGFQLNRAGDAEATIEPAGTRFTGRTTVLIDAANASATFTFAAMMRALRLGTLVGEPTGGNLRGINGGAFFFLTLPHTGIEIDLPLIGYFPHQPQVDGGLIPDLTASLTAGNVASGRDPALEAARRIAAGVVSVTARNARLNVEFDTGPASGTVASTSASSSAQLNRSTSSLHARDDAAMLTLNR